MLSAQMYQIDSSAKHKQLLLHVAATVVSRVSRHQVLGSDTNQRNTHARTQTHKQTNERTNEQTNKHTHKQQAHAHAQAHTHSTDTLAGAGAYFASESQHILLIMTTCGSLRRSRVPLVLACNRRADITASTRTRMWTHICKYIHIENFYIPEYESNK